MVGIKEDTKEDNESAEVISKAWRDKADWPHPSPYGHPST